MSDEDTTNTKQQRGPKLSARDELLNQVVGEVDKGRRESLKAKLKTLILEKAELDKALAVNSKKINDELDKFEQGL